MFEVGQYLALHHESAQDRISVHPTLYQLYRHLLAILIIRAGSQINCPHPTVTQLSNDFVWSEPSSRANLDFRLFDFFCASDNACINQCGRVEERPGRGVCRKQFFYSME